MFSNKKIPKNPQIFKCINCYYNTCNKKDYNKHLQTQKHFSNDNQCLSIKNPQKSQKIFKCFCGNEYRDNSGLWRHKKKCIQKDETKNINNKENKDEDIKELFTHLMKENSEIMKNTIIEVIKSGIITNNSMSNSHNIITNNNNKTFNLQIFLNETCKDAMNMSEFINSLQIEYDDFEKVGEIGFVNGISNIIIKNLKDLDVTKRPLHCTDKKREIIYVKEDNKWEKEDDNYTKTRKLIKKTADKNMRMIPEFKKKYPDCGKSSSKYSDKYDLLIIETMGGSGDNDFEKETKILKNITKEVVINKVL
jgi:hypothetical protein